MVVSSYEYDANGNRARSISPAGAVVATYDAQDRLLTHGVVTYAYTASGMLRLRALDGDTTRYLYNELGDLLEVKLASGRRVEYVVDGRNRRIGKRIDGAFVRGFLYEGPYAPAAELDASGAVVSRFVYGSRVNVPDYMTRDERTYQLVTDHRGSVRLVVNTETGEIAQRLDYDEFGRVLLNTNPDFQPFGFAGGLYDEDTKLVRFGARDYDAETGRWTAKDPIGFVGGSSNLYAYVGGDPINDVDPSGLVVSVYGPHSRRIVIDLYLNCPTFKRIYDALSIAPKHKVNLVIRDATEQDLADMLWAGKEGGMFTKPMLSSNGLVLIDARKNNLEEIMVEEMAHAAGAYSHVAPTGVPPACFQPFNDAQQEACVEPVKTTILHERARKP